MKVSTALRFAQEVLSSIEDEKYAKWEALLILSHLLKISPLQVYLFLEEEVPEREFLRLLDERRKKKPLAYILKEVCFWGRDFYVEEGVLIPRQETEILIQAFLELNLKKCKVLELGIGSGVIAITILLEITGAKVFGVDISSSALGLAKRNAERYRVGHRLFLLKGDWFEPIKERADFDVIVSNPPYVSEDEWRMLEEDVRLYEPKEALVAGKKGTEYQERLLKDAYRFLKKGGFLIFEIGYNQSEDIEVLLKSYNWCYRFYKDLRSYKRVVVAWKEGM